MLAPTCTADDYSQYLSAAFAAATIVAIGIDIKVLDSRTISRSARWTAGVAFVGFLVSLTLGPTCRDWFWFLTTWNAPVPNLGFSLLAVAAGAAVATGVIYSLSSIFRVRAMRPCSTCGQVFADDDSLAEHRREMHDAW